MSKPNTNEPFVVAPDDFVTYLRERWIDEIDSGSSTISELILPYLEDRAIEKISNECRPAKSCRPDKDKEGWRLWWLNEARHNCISFGTAPRADGHLSRVGESSVNQLMIASRLRDALEAGRAEMSCALGMLLIAEVLAGGYSIEVAATEKAKSLLEGSRKKAYEGGIGSKKKDLTTANGACIAVAQNLWTEQPSLRIGLVADRLRSMLKANLDKLPTLSLADIPGADTIKDWLRSAAKAGKLNIPAAAQRRGRPRKQKN